MSTVRHGILEVLVCLEVDFEIVQDKMVVVNQDPFPCLAHPLNLEHSDENLLSGVVIVVAAEVELVSVQTHYKVSQSN